MDEIIEFLKVAGDPKREGYGNPVMGNMIWFFVVAGDPKREGYGNSTMSASRLSARSCR